LLNGESSYEKEQQVKVEGRGEIRLEWKPQVSIHKGKGGSMLNLFGGRSQKTVYEKEEMRNGPNGEKKKSQRGGHGWGPAALKQGL